MTLTNDLTKEHVQIERQIRNNKKQVTTRGETHDITT